jgi:hypothetical protein
VPEEVDRTGLAVKAARELLEDPVYSHQRVMEASEVPLVAGAMVSIGVKGILVEVEGYGVYRDFYSQRTEPLEQPVVELRDR